MTALELPERVRRVVYYLAVLTGALVAVGGAVLATAADRTPWFRGLNGLDGYLLTLVGAIAASHLPGKAITPAGDEVPLDQSAPADDVADGVAGVSAPPAPADDVADGVADGVALVPSLD